MNIYELKGYEMHIESLKFNKTAYGSKAFSYIILPLFLSIIFFCVGFSLILSELAYHYGNGLVLPGLMCLIITSIFFEVYLMNQLQYGRMLKEYIESKEKKDE